MNSKGIFDKGAGDSGEAGASPFAAAPATGETQPNPFGGAGPQASPFAVAGAEAGAPTGERPQLEPGKPARIPDKRPGGGEPSPFSLAEPSEGFGFEAAPGAASAAPAAAAGASPFESAASPFAAAPEAAPAPAPPAPAPAPAPPEPVAAAAPPSTPPPVAEAVKEAKPEPKPEAKPEAKPPGAWPAPAEKSAAAPAAVSAATATTLGASGGTIRQLELRAIFGVDRELSGEEILQRLRGLAGIRKLERIGADSLEAVEVLNRSLSGLASEGTSLRLSFGNVPVEFIREGRAVLAVMTDGSFAPGVRETMIIAARELDRMA